MQEQTWAQEPEFPVLTSTSSLGSGIPPAGGVGVGDCFVTTGGDGKGESGNASTFWFQVPAMWVPQLYSFPGFLPHPSPLHLLQHSPSPLLSFRHAPMH